MEINKILIISAFYILIFISFASAVPQFLFLKGTTQIDGRNVSWWNTTISFYAENANIANSSLNYNGEYNVVIQNYPQYYGKIIHIYIDGNEAEQKINYTFPKDINLNLSAFTDKALKITPSPPDNITISKVSRIDFTPNVFSGYSDPIYYKWYLDGDLVSENPNYHYDINKLSEHKHKIKVIVSDGYLTKSNEWTLNIIKPEEFNQTSFKWNGLTWYRGNTGENCNSVCSKNGQACFDGFSDDDNCTVCTALFPGSSCAQGWGDFCPAWSNNNICWNGKSQNYIPSKCSSGSGSYSRICGCSGGVAITCGNGLDNFGEECDDGNLINGDGCSLLCKIEYNNPCSGKPIDYQTEDCDGDHYCDGKGKCVEMFWKYSRSGPGCMPSNQTKKCMPSTYGTIGNKIDGGDVEFYSKLNIYDRTSPFGQVQCDVYECESSSMLSFEYNNSTWYSARAGESCTTTCSKNGLICNNGFNDIDGMVCRHFRPYSWQNNEIMPSGNYFPALWDIICYNNFTKTSSCSSIAPSEFHRLCKCDSYKIYNDYCGDDICNNGESCSSCSSDCGQCSGGSSNGGSSSGGSSGHSSSSSSSNNPENVNYQYATSEQMKNGYTQELGINDQINFNLNSEVHKLTVNSIGEDYATITIESEPIYLKIHTGESKKLSIANSNYYDLYIKLESISNSKAEFTIKEINEPIKRQGISGEVISNIETGKLAGALVLGILAAVILLMLIKIKEKKLKKTKKR